jgi:hypothetical protein
MGSHWVALKVSSRGDSMADLKVTSTAASMETCWVELLAALKVVEMASVKVAVLDVC